MFLILLDDYSESGASKAVFARSFGERGPWICDTKRGVECYRQCGTRLLDLLLPLLLL